MTTQINWELGCPSEGGTYLVTICINGEKAVLVDNFMVAANGRGLWCGYPGAVLAWCKLSNVEPCNIN